MTILITFNSYLLRPFLIKGILVLLLSTIGLSLSAQNKKLKKAIEHYEFQEYSEAIPLLKKALDENEKLYTAEKLLANSYRKIRDFSNAELHYIITVNSDSSVAEDHLYYGQVLKANGKLAAAKEQFLKFSELTENEFLGNIMLQSIDEIKSWDEIPKEFNTKPQSKLNSEKTEFGLWIFKDKVYITSDRAENFYSPESSSWTGDPFLSIYESDTSILSDQESDDFRLEKGLINSNYHDGPLTINPEEDRVVISRIANQMRGKDFINRMKLFEGEYVNGSWKNFKELPFNSDEYSVGHAVFADSGKTLYFSSDMPGGYGGMDLYLVKREETGWGSPRNLGAAINTIKNEVFPYVKDSVLYFSSDGFVGYGGLDIFYSKKTRGAWQAPENMKMPVNSSQDDFSIYFVTDSTGFYASNRTGGKGKDDIYSFKKTHPQIKVKLHALFEYEGLPIEGIKVILLDQEDSIVEVKYTDEKGRFTFDNLPYKSNYLIQVETEDGDNYNGGRLFLTDAKYNKIQLLTIIRSGLYSFKALPIEEVQFALEEVTEPVELDQFIFTGKIFKKLPGDTKDQLVVYLVNDDGEIIDSVLTDEFGNFSFEHLNSEENYLLRIKESDPDLNIAFVNSQGRIYDLAKTNINRPIGVENQLDASQQVKKSKNEGYTTLIARLEHRGLPLKYTKIDIYNTKDELVATVISNEFGEFQFNHLEFDDIYLIDLPEVDDKTKFETLLYVINDNGEALYLINQIRDGKYKFFSLPYDEYEKVQKIEASYVPNIVKVAGQLYKKLPGDFSDGVTVYVLSEEGEVIDSVLTDKDGQFKFEKLRSDQSYTFKVSGGGEGFNLALLDENDVVIDKAILNDKGNFAYKKLTYQVAQFEPLDLVETGIIEDKYTHQIYGQVYQKLPGDFGDSMKVYIYDDEGNFLGTAYTDSEGKFEFSKLKEDENYIIKIEHDDKHFQLLTLDENEQILDKTIKNHLGKFKYTKLGMTHHEILLADASDHQVVYYDSIKIDLKKFTVNYRFDSTSLEPFERVKLDQLFQVLKNKDLMIEVISHTDKRGPEAYNKYLSEERTKNVIRYLKQMGLPKEQMVGNFFGELRPVIDCEKYKCDNDDHRLNRRTEFKFLDFELNEPDAN